MNTNIIIQDNTRDIAAFSIIQNKIHEIRGKNVMLDFDLAAMYEVETKNLNLSVKRNLRRFPADFMFQLTPEEWDSLRLQNETSKRGGRRYLPYAFTEQGIAMLSGLLNSDVAIGMNILIMRAFVMLRQYSLNYAELNNKIEDLICKIDARFDKNDVIFKEIFKVLDDLIRKKQELEKPRTPIGFVQKKQ
jgi:hypothetical protein